MDDIEAWFYLTPASWDGSTLHLRAEQAVEESPPPRSGEVSLDVPPREAALLDSASKAADSFLVGISWHDDDVANLRALVRIAGDGEVSFELPDSEAVEDAVRSVAARFGMSGGEVLMEIIQEPRSAIGERILDSQEMRERAASTA